MSKFDVKFFNPFILGTIKTLNTQCNLEITTDKPFIKGTQPQPLYAIAGVIGITSTAFNGTITLCFPENVFLGVMSKMLGEEYKEINKELQDGAGELLNIIFGQAKTTLSDQGYSIQKAIPTVIRGSAITTTLLSKDPTLVLPFKAEFGIFHVEISTDLIMP